MSKRKFVLVFLFMTLTSACAGVSTDSITDATQGAVQLGNKAIRPSGCNGLDIIAEVEAAGRANPYRAMQEYDDVDNMRGCLEGTIIGFPAGQITPGQPIADQAIGITIDVHVEEHRGFTLGYTVPEPPEPPDALRESMPEDLTQAQEAEWQLRYDAAAANTSRPGMPPMKRKLGPWKGGRSSRCRPA